MTSRAENMRLFASGGTTTDAELASSIALALGDLNDMLRLAMKRGITVTVGTNRTVVDPSGSRLDPVSIRLMKVLL